MKKFETKKQLAEYIWDYYKLPILSVAFVLIIGISILTSILSQPKYDYTVALVSTRPYGQNALDSIAGYLSEYGSDCNGDGIINIEMICYDMVQADSAMLTTSTAQFLADYQMHRSSLYLMESGTEAFVLSEGSFLPTQKSAEIRDTTYTLVFRDSPSGSYAAGKDTQSAWQESLALWNALPER